MGLDFNYTTPRELENIVNQQKEDTKTGAYIEQESSRMIKLYNQAETITILSNTFKNYFPLLAMPCVYIIHHQPTSYFINRCISSMIMDRFNEFKNKQTDDQKPKYE